jgi:hypothetical protein
MWVTKTQNLTNASFISGPLQKIGKRFPQNKYQHNRCWCFSSFSTVEKLSALFYCGKVLGPFLLWKSSRPFFNCGKVLGPFLTVEKFSALFLSNIFRNSSTDWKLASNSAFLVPVLNISAKCLCHNSIFCKLWSRMRTDDNHLLQCLLEFNFANISRSGLFTFWKQVKIVVPYLLLG